MENYTSSGSGRRVGSRSRLHYGVPAGRRQADLPTNCGGTARQNFSPRPEVPFSHYQPGQDLYHGTALQDATGFGSDYMSDETTLPLGDLSNIPEQYTNTPSRSQFQLHGVDGGDVHLVSMLQNQSKMIKKLLVEQEKMTKQHKSFEERLDKFEEKFNDVSTSSASSSSVEKRSRVPRELTVRCCMYLHIYCKLYFLRRRKWPLSMMLLKMDLIQCRGKYLISVKTIDHIKIILSLLPTCSSLSESNQNIKQRIISQVLQTPDCAYSQTQVTGNVQDKIN